MTNDEITQYLANILCVIRADGVIDILEESALETIRLEIKAKKTNLNAARKQAELPDFIATPVGRYSDKIKNIEDMVFVSMIDGEIANEESQVITTFAKKAGCTQDQISLVVSETKSRLKASQQEVSCSSCNQKVLADSKFCSKCGHPISAETKKTVDKVKFDYPLKGISVEFSESSSALFSSALSSASNASVSFQECTRNKKKWYLATWHRAEMTEVLKLVDNLKGLRNRIVYIDGEEKPWDEVFGFLWCYQQRQQSYQPLLYCFGQDNNGVNICGCNKANMNWGEWADWLSFGQFRSKDVFVFDKARISHEIKVNLHKLRYCPALKVKLIQKVIELLPNEVKVSKKSGWKYNEEYDAKPGSIKVTENVNEDGYNYKNEFYSDGVRPIGFSIASKILKQALKECGMEDINLKAITN